MAAFPNVPNVPGVPPLLRNLITPPPQNNILAQSDFAPDFQNDRPVWGVYKNGQLAIQADSVQTFEYRNDWNISDYPLEQSQDQNQKVSFESYNKVPTPFSVKLRLASGRTSQEREQFLNQVTAVASSLDLYDVITPERTYPSMNVGHVDLNRSNKNGVGMIMVDIWFTEIRIKAQAAFSKVSSPTSADPQSNGTVQTTAPTTAQTSAVAPHEFNQADGEAYYAQFAPPGGADSYYAKYGPPASGVQ